MRTYRAVKIFWQMLKTPYPPGYHGFKLSVRAMASLAWYLSDEENELNAMHHVRL